MELKNFLGQPHQPDNGPAPVALLSSTTLNLKPDWSCWGHGRSVGAADVTGKTGKQDWGYANGTDTMGTREEKKTGFDSTLSLLYFLLPNLGIGGGKPFWEKTHPPNHYLIFAPRSLSGVLSGVSYHFYPI